MTFEGFPTADDLKPPRKGFKRCEGCSRNRALKFFKPKGRKCSTCLKRRTKLASRDVRIVDTHNITSAEYDEIMGEQEGVCAICGGPRNYRLDVDHDHAVERSLIAQGMSAPLAHRASIRGALCKACNRRLLPACKDDPQILRNAIHYLLHPPAHMIIGRPE